MVNFDKLLPVGSIVLLDGAVKKLMIAGIAQSVQREGEAMEHYDYIGVLYPEGYLSQESMVLFNHEQINDVIYRGYENPERERFIDFVKEQFENKEGDPQ